MTDDGCRGGSTVAPYKHFKNNKKKQEKKKKKKKKKKEKKEKKEKEKKCCSGRIKTGKVTVIESASCR